MPPMPGMPAPWGTVLGLSCAVAAMHMKTKKSNDIFFIPASLLHSIEFHGQMLAIFGSDQPQIIPVLNGGAALHYLQVAILLLGKNPGLVLQSLWMTGLQDEFVLDAAKGPVHLGARIQEVRQSGHGVPAEAALGGKFTGVLHPVLQRSNVAGRAQRMGIHQPRHVIARGVIGNADQPRLHQGLGHAVEIHLFQAGLGAEMKNREAPDIRVRTGIAINPRRPHAGIAGEVIADETMLLQPLGHPFWMIAQGSRVFPYLLAANYLLQRLVIFDDVLGEILFVIVVEVLAEIVVNPSAVAANGIAVLLESFDPLPGFGIMLHIQTLVVVEGIHVRAGREVRGKWSLVKDAGLAQYRHRLECRGGIDVPVEYQSASTVRH